MQDILENPASLTELQNTIKQLSNHLALEKAEKRDLEKKLKDINKKIDETSDQLRKMMEAQDMQNFTTSRGTFYINRQTRARVIDTALAFPFLRSSGLGSLIKETVNASSLSSAVKEMVESGALDLSQTQNLGVEVCVDETVKILGLDK